MKSTGLVLMLMLILSGNAKGQENGQERYAAAFDLWNAGDYPESLDYMLELLKSGDADKWLKPIALLTGEMYKVEEVAVDGRNIQWSPTGRYFTFDTNGQTQIVARDKAILKSLGGITARRLIFHPTGDEIAYLFVNDTPEITVARVAMENMRRTRDFSNFRKVQAKLNRLEWNNTEVNIRNLITGEEKTINTGNLSIMGIAYKADGKGLFLTTGPTQDTNENQIYTVSATELPEYISNLPGLKGRPQVVPGGRYLIYSLGQDTFVLHDLRSDESATFAGTSLNISSDGSTIVFLARDGVDHVLQTLHLSKPLSPQTLQRTSNRLANPVLSADGSNIAYQMMLREDWEIFIVNQDGTEEKRVTYDIQHDIFPAFKSENTLLGIIGEGRHRRSFLYDIRSGEITRLFHNNTIRTIAPEYEWAVHPGGTHILIVSERDGDTISPERGVYLVDLNEELQKKDIITRLEKMMASERNLRQRGHDMFEKIEEDVRNVIKTASVNRIFGYARDLHRFGSKYITEPGNQKAIEYLTNTLQSFGYEVEQQWFEPRGVRSANVIATLPGTLHPDLVYVISSHFDSVRRGPGADDNTSGTTALIEAARILADHPMPATIQFAFFTGEEAGLLGSREFVRRAVENKVELLGALNNDMVGWANNHKLDDTIRFSNEGIRDVQHAAAFLFTDLITYDAKYYKSTDAHAYYDVYGDIVGGIGSYPVLSSPHYHQAHDVLEIINQTLVTEVSKTTVGTIMLMASSPARLKELQIEDRDGEEIQVRWTAAPEKDIATYLVTYGSDSDHLKSVSVQDSRATLSGVKSGMVISVKAVNTGDMSSWDWVKIIVD